MAGAGGGPLAGRGPGSYALVCRLEEARIIAVGRLGQVRFPAGWYVYVGSGRGPGGVAARVARHLRRCKRFHWHVDYLLRHATVVEVWLQPGRERQECHWAQILAQDGVRRPPGFGASDCRCPGHLIHFARRPDAHLFRALGASPQGPAAFRQAPPAIPCGRAPTSGKEDPTEGRPR